MRLDIDPEPLADGAKDRGEIVHARIALVGEHAVEAFRGLAGFSRQPLETHRRIDEMEGARVFGIL